MFLNKITGLKKTLIPIVSLAMVWILVHEWRNSTETIIVICILLLFTALINLLTYRSIIKRLIDFTPLLLPELWIVATSAVVFFQTTFLLGLMFAVFGTLIFLKLEMNLFPKPETIFFENITFLSALGIFSLIFSLQFYFLLHWYLIVILTMLSVFLFALIEFYQAPTPTREKLLFSAVLALLAGELAWIMYWWPVHFLTTAASFFGIYYIAIIMSKIYLMGSLNRTKIVFHSVFFFVYELVVLIGAVWLPKN